MGWVLDPTTGAILVKTVGAAAPGSVTEYAEGDVAPLIAGGVVMWEDAADTIRAVSAAHRLPVELPAGGGGLTDAELRASAVPVSLSTGIDVIDRALRLLGVVSVTGTVTVTGPLTDTQLRATPVPVSGTVTASGPLTDVQLRAAVVPTQDARLPAALDADGGLKVHAQSAIPVTDNGGSLTVDGPLTDAALRASAVPVSGPVTDVQLRASAVPVSGPLTDVQLRASAVPVSMATQTPDVTDRAARELGRVRIWDGTDEATVLPLRTAPATTEKVIVTSEMPARLRTYQAVTAEVAPAITIGVKELLCLFHPAAVTSDAYIVEIVVSILVTTASTTAGRTNVEVFKVTSAPTGGTNLAAADVGGALGTSDIITNAAANVMQAKTGGGALGTAVIRQGLEHALQPVGAQRFEIFKASSVGNGIILRGGSADGINIQVNRVAAHTALVDQWTASIRWIEL